MRAKICCATISPLSAFSALTLKLQFITTKSTADIKVYVQEAKEYAKSQKQLHKRQYSGFSIIRTPIICIRTFGCRVTSPCFRYQREKYVAVAEVLLQDKAKLMHERLPERYNAFFMQYVEFRLRFTTSELAERSRKCCSTLYYSVAN